MNSRVLVTGCAGYIGSILTPMLLEAGFRVRGYDSLLFGGNGLLGVLGNENFEFIRGDVRDGAVIHNAMFDVDAVVWLAALVGEPACNKNCIEAQQINFESVAAGADGISGRQFIFSSTCSNYGIKENGLATENTLVNPVSLYSKTKVNAENALEGKATILRFATAYGLSPRMRFDLLLNEWVKDALTKNYISVYGAESWRPFAHVRDIARAIIFCLKNNIPYQTINVGGENWQKKDLAVAAATPMTKVALAEGKSDPRNYRVSFDKLKRLGFECQYSVADGIREMTNALRDGAIIDPYSGVYSNA